MVLHNIPLYILDSFQYIKSPDRRYIILVEDRVLIFAKLFSCSSSEYKNLYGFHNEIYQIIGDTDFILRIASASHRSKDATLSELEFLLFLKKREFQ
jgi:hypothetical protein